MKRSTGTEDTLDDKPKRINNPRAYALITREPEDY